MYAKLQQPDESILKKLHRIYPRPLMCVAAKNMPAIDRLVDIEFARRTLDGVRITPVGIAYCMLDAKIEAAASRGSQMPIFEDEAVEKKTGSIN